MKRAIQLAWLLPALIAQPLAVHAAMHWAPAPPKHAGHAHGGHDRSAAKPFMLVEGRGAIISLLKPDLSRSSLTAERGVVKFTPTGMDNYHALIASRLNGVLHETAIRYVYMHGKPSGESPSLLTAEQKSTLEIEPAPLAREHWRYLSGEEARFLVRFRGEPLAGAVVTMKNGNGSSAEFVSGTDGYVEFVLPDDFKEVRPGRRSNRPSEFVMTSGHNEGKERFVTTFSSAYFVNPSHWQSLPLGAATAFGGMLLGGLLTFRRMSFRNLRRREK